MAVWEYCCMMWVEWEVSDDQKAALKETGFPGDIVEDAYAPSIMRGGHLKFLGSSQDAESFTELGETIARLGQDGWEMVSHTEVTTPFVASVFYFKREVKG